MSEEVCITGIGRSGDGLTELDGATRFVPFALPGEKVRVAAQGKRMKLLNVLEPSHDRIDPICRHFGRCGGCQLQHFAHEPYLAWKENLLREALERSGIESAIEPMRGFGPNLRRRVNFTAHRKQGILQFGFLERGNDRIVELSECAVLTPELEKQLPRFRELADMFATGKSTLKISALECDNGTDVSLAGSVRPKERVIQRAISAAGKLGFARISFNGEVLIELTKPILLVGSAQVTPPPISFAQAVKDAEQAMAKLVTQHLYDCKQVADLFCGMGAFALRLAEQSSVFAAEMDGPAVEALERAWRQTGGKLKAIRTEKRDLFRRPLMTRELKQYDGVVFDPPRVGAEAQSRQLAASSVRKVAAVSCNPTTLARDLSILIEGGYRLRSVTPVDQFIFTPHLEAVALLER